MIEVPGYIKGLIFDCDGTLVDSMPLHMEAWENAIKKFNAPWDYEFFFSKKGMSEKDIILLYLKEYLQDINGDEIVKTKHDYFKQHISTVKLIEPVVDVALKYKSILPMSVASGGTEEIVIGELKATGILNLFDYILTSDNKIKPKPAPDIFLSAAKLMNIDPQLCQVFEDGDLGLLAAYKAGMLALDVRPLL